MKLQPTGKQEYSPITFQQQLTELSRLTGITGAVCTVAAVTSLLNGFTQPKGLQSIQLFSSTALLSYVAKRNVMKWMALNDIKLDLEMTNRREQVVAHRSALTEPQQIGAEIEFDDDWIERNLIKDFTNYWLKAEKHLLIVAGTGDGKSTLLKAGVIPGLKNQIQGNWLIKAYDVDATKKDYTTDVEVFRQYSDIGAEMVNDMEELEKRVQVRWDEADNFNEQPQLIIAEELPALVTEITIEEQWIAKIAKRGRKVRMFCVAIAQNDTVKNLGLKGDNDLKNSCFVTVYAGSKAVARAKSLKNDVLVQWLEEQPKGRYLVDDLPMEWILNKSLPQVTSEPLLNHSDSLRSLRITSVTPKHEEVRKSRDYRDDAFIASVAAIRAKTGDITINEVNEVMRLHRSRTSNTKIVNTVFNVSSGDRFTALMGHVKAINAAYDESPDVFDFGLDKLETKPTDV